MTVGLLRLSQEVGPSPTATTAQGAGHLSAMVLLLHHLLSALLPNEFYRNSKNGRGKTVPEHDKLLSQTGYGYVNYLRPEKK